MRWMSKLGHWIRREGMNMLIALVAAIMVCYYISEEITGERTLEVPIQFELPKTEDYRGVEVVWQSIRNVQVTVQGPKVKLNFLPQNLVLRPRVLAGTPQGERVVLPLSAEYLHLPPGVHCREIRPAQVEFILSRRGQKKVPVRLRLDPPTLPSHIRIDYYEPESVFIKGPEYLLEELSQVYTSPIHWKKIRSSRVERFSVQIPEAYKGELICDQTVAVKFTVSKPLEKCSLFLRVFVLLSENFPYVVDLHTKKVHLTFRGSKQVLDLLQVNPEKYLDVYIVPEELDQAEIRPMDKNSEPPKELPLKIHVDPQLKDLEVPSPKDLPTVKFYLLQKSSQK